MPIPIPTLDDRTFAELVEAAQRLIPQHAPEWTDHNLHDPGMTFIDLFAWLAEMQLYSLDQVTEQHLKKYLALLGVQPRPATPAALELQLTAPDAATVDAGTVLTAEVDAVEIPFETDEAFEVLPVTVRYIVSYANYQVNEVTAYNAPQKAYFAAFGKQPKPGDALYLGLSTSASDGWEALKGKILRLGVTLFEDDLPPVGQHDEETLPIWPSVALAWEFMPDGDPLRLVGPEEGVQTVSRSGQIALQIPDTPNPQTLFSLPDECFWIRARLHDGRYEIPPRIARIGPNAVSATQGRTILRERFGTSSGLPYQTRKAQHIPVIAGSHAVTVDGDLWSAVPDFDASQPTDTHYTIDLMQGNVLFGDGIYGMVPPKGADIIMTYRQGGGTRGNIKADTPMHIDRAGVNVSNPFAADGGTEAETIAHAFRRFRRDLHVPYTAVTAEDYAYIAKATPGLRVARAYALVPSRPENTVIVIVVPYSPLEKPVPGRGFLRTVCEHLDRHRLLTTSLIVRKPDYVQVSVVTTLRIRSGANPERVRSRVEAALNRFLSPIRREPGDNAWPFGRPVYRSEVYEVVELTEGVDCVTELALHGSGGPFSRENGDLVIGELALVYPGNHSIDVFDPGAECRKESSL